ncbi:hypothetical protein AB0H73_33795 [Streptomyces olivoreticuli]
MLTGFERKLDHTPFALYEVRRLHLPGRMKDCRTWHDKRCTETRWWCRTKRSAACRRGHRAGFEAKWTAVTGLAGTRRTPIRPLVVPIRERSMGVAPVRPLRKKQRALTMEPMA